MRNGNPEPAGTLIDAQADDMALLRRYVERGSQDAFNLIVSRHLNWVSATCRKGLRDRHMAEDAAQAVFIILARRAATLSQQTRLSGWLFNTARFVIKDAKKQEARYRRRENVAREMNGIRLSPVREPVDAQTQAQLDDAMATLTERDRLALLMHFYEGLSLQEMADTLGITKDGAKKRVGRALSRLRTRIARNNKNAAASIAVLALLLRSRAAEAAPVGMAQTVASSAIVPGVASSVAKWMAQRAMSTAAGASSRLLRALVAAELTAAVGLVGVWTMPSRPTAVVSTGTVTAVAQATHVVSEPAMPAPGPTGTAPLAVEEPEGPYRSGAFDPEPRVDPLPPYPESKQLSQNTGGTSDSTAATGFGGAAGGSPGITTVATGRRPTAEPVTAPQAIARAVAQSALSTPPPSRPGARPAAPAAVRHSAPVASAQASAPSPKIPSSGKDSPSPTAPSEPVAGNKPPAWPPVARVPGVGPPGEFFHRHDVAPPPSTPFQPEPHPQPDSHAAYRPASFSHEWPDPPARDGRIEVAVATADADTDAGFGHWHIRRLYARDADRAGMKTFGTSGKRRISRAGTGHKLGLGHFDDDDDAATTAAGEQLVPFVKAEDILGDAPNGPAAQSELVRNDAAAAPAFVHARGHRAFGFEVAPAAAAAAFDTGPMSAPPIAFAQAPEPGSLGLTLLAAGAGLLTRRRRRRNPAGN